MYSLQDGYIFQFEWLLRKKQWNFWALDFLPLFEILKETIFKHLLGQTFFVATHFLFRGYLTSINSERNAKL